EVEVAVLEAEVLARVLLALLVCAHHERERLGRVEHLEVADVHLDVARREVRILPLPFAHDALDGDDVLAAEPLGRGVGLGGDLLGEDDLREAVTVAEVGEDEATEVPLRVHPPLEDHFAADVAGAEGAAGVRAAAVLRVRRGREAGGLGHGAGGGGEEEGRGGGEDEQGRKQEGRAVLGLGRLNPLLSSPPPLLLSSPASSTGTAAPSPVPSRSSREGARRGRRSWTRSTRTPGGRGGSASPARRGRGRAR